MQYLDTLLSCIIVYIQHAILAPMYVISEGMTTIECQSLDDVHCFGIVIEKERASQRGAS